MAAAVLATLLVLMFAGHQMTSGSRHAAGCAHATVAGAPDAASATGAGPTPARDTVAHAMPGAADDCAGDCGVLLICTLLLTAVLVAARATAGRDRTGHRTHVLRETFPVGVALRGPVTGPDLVALGICRT